VIDCRFVLHTNDAVKAREYAKKVDEENKTLQNKSTEKNQQLNVSRELLICVQEKINTL